jgi:aminotransferase
MIGLEGAKPLRQKRPLTNAKVARLPASGIRRFFDLIAGAEGGISLGVGEPDFITPESYREAAIRSIKEGKTKYTSNYGIKPLREAISEHTAKLRGVRYDVDREILVTVGVSEAVDLALRATLNDGDEVILADPSYVAYVPGIVLAGGVPAPVPTEEADDFRLTPAAVATAITPRTRAILLGFPNNPTGAALRKDDVAGIAKLAKEHDLLVYADEIYDRLVYGMEHHSIVSEPGMKERTIYLAGFSKSYAMTGWRVGYACAPAEIIEQMMKIHQYTVMCVPTAAQYAALEALRNGEADVVRMVKAYDERRKLMWRRFNAMGLHCFEPRGAFYCFPNVTSTGLDDDTFCERLLKEEKVVVVPGNAFGERGKGHVRACYAASTENIGEACDRIERFIARL